MGSHKNWYDALERLTGYPAEKCYRSHFRLMYPLPPAEEKAIHAAISKTGGAVAILAEIKRVRD